MTLAFAMRTADRKPHPNYLGRTLRSFVASGGDISRLHLCLSRPESLWLCTELADDPPHPILHVPTEKRSANANGLSCIEAALADDAEMIVLLEDDIEFCADFVGSLSRWLDDWVRPDRHVYKVFGFTTPPKDQPAAYDWPMAGMRASQVIILRRDDAADFLSWGTKHHKDWVPLAPWGRKFPHVTNPGIAFDKFVATWALLRWPGTPCVMSHPYFVKHIGDKSTLHRVGARNDKPFAGAHWSYQGMVCQ